MRKSTIAMLVLAGLAAGQVAMASAPVSSDIRFECPKASGGVASERLTNYGASISGMGEENFGSMKFSPVYHGVSNPAIPLDLSTGGYSNAGTLYTNDTGRVTCLYSSSLAFPSFNVSYQMVNGLDGIVIKSSNSAITVRVPQGAV